VREKLAGLPHLTAPKIPHTSFVVQHYAGEVLLLCVCVFTYIHTRTHARAHTHTHLHTHTHTHVQVLYSTEGFVDSNRDLLQPALVDLMAASSSPFVKELFTTVFEAVPAAAHAPGSSSSAQGQPLRRGGPGTNAETSSVLCLCMPNQLWR
jgi:hypothetical protein